MKGLILAAGRGTRLGALTADRSKAMVPLAGRPLISYPLEKLQQVEINDIGLVVSSNEQELREGLADYSGRCSFTFIRQEQPLGLAHAVNCAKDFTAGEDFVLLFCDNIFSETLHGALAEWERLRAEHGDCALIHTIEMPDPRACGVAVLGEDYFVTELEEKPQQPKSNLAVVGIDFFTPKIYEAISHIGPSARGEYEITDAISELIRMGCPVKALPLRGWWYDTGTPDDLKRAEAAVLTHAGQPG
ncbi:NTP transferase domain-containing protein [bacterium]|nr:NTP transferase domain-containing protein [bacterium]